MASSSSSIGALSSSSGISSSSSSSGSSSSSSSSSGMGGIGGTGGAPATLSGETALLPALIALLQTGASPQVLAAQQALMRRLILEGDVIPSRLPAPKNITEMGGYLNLLTRLGERTMRSEVLASVLGVAPAPGLLYGVPGHPLAMVPVPNDRPASGPAQVAAPLTWYVRSDFQKPFLAALSQLHANGGILPLYSQPVSLPPGTPTFSPPSDWLPYIGREVWVFPPAALANPASDAIVLARATPGPPYQLMANVTSGATPGTWYALQASGGVISEIATTASLVPLAPLLVGAGFYPANPLPVPANTSDVSWARLTNITGLIPGVTTLGSELSLLYAADEIGASAMMPYVSYVWNGTSFSPQ